MVIVSSTRRIELVAKHVVFESACWLECQRVAQDTVEDRIGSKFIVCFKNNSKQQKLDMERDHSQTHQTKCT